MGIIPNMSSSKIVMVVIALSLGIALGLAYGWVIEPVEYTDVTPNILREDYRVDYVLMVAESYQNDLDAEEANQRLAALGSEPPASIAASALDYATRNDFAPEEMQALQNLLTAMQTYQPQGNVSP